MRLPKYRQAISVAQALDLTEGEAKPITWEIRLRVKAYPHRDHLLVDISDMDTEPVWVELPLNASVRQVN